MPVAVQSHHPRRPPSAGAARFAVGGGTQAGSTRHAPCELLAADRRGEFLAMVLAAKYTKPGGRVTVSLGATSAEVVLRVRDTGVGIAPEVLPFVFDPFVREGIPGVRPKRGSGVGLLLVRTLVELHGGRAEASSAGRGRGNEFVVRLPVADWD